MLESLMRSGRGRGKPAFSLSGKHSRHDSQGWGQTAGDLTVSNPRPNFPPGSHPALMGWRAKELPKQLNEVGDFKDTVCPCCPMWKPPPPGLFALQCRAAVGRGKQVWKALSHVPGSFYPLNLLQSQSQPTDSLNRATCPLKCSACHHAFVMLSHCPGILCLQSLLARVQS